MCRDAIDRVPTHRHSPTRTRSIASLQITRKDGEPIISYSPAPLHGWMHRHQADIAKRSIIDRAAKSYNSPIFLRDESAIRLQSQVAIQCFWPASRVIISSFDDLILCC